MRLERNITIAFSLISTVAADAVGQCEPVWSGLDGGADWQVRAIAPFDEDGGGPAAPALFAAGGFFDFAGIETSRLLARWDGWQASPVGGGLTASDYGAASLVAVHEPVGMLPAGLYVGGEFDQASGLSLNNLARWHEGAWHDVGGGVTHSGTRIPYVFAMKALDEDGEGALPPALFVGGIFEHAGGVPVQSLARWDGREWSAVGGELGASGLPTVFAMTVYDDGRGPALYVGGGFTRAGGEPALNVARWDGEKWESVGGGLNGSVHSLCVFDEDGSGPKRPALFAGGQFSAATFGTIEVTRIARWDGSEWSAVGGWKSSGSILAMIAWDGFGPGSGKQSLYIGGLFSKLPDGSSANKVARWDGEGWHVLGAGVSGFGAGTGVDALAAFDEDGPGPNPGGLYVGGLFYRAGAVETKHIARWGCPLPPSPPCYADCDGSGELAFFDFLCFQNQFAAADPVADCDGDAAFTFFDFLCFQNAFAAGCP